MKKKYAGVLIVMLIAIIVLFLLFNNINKNEVPIYRQIENTKTTSEHDYSIMGNSYMDKIYEKYDSIEYGKQNIYSMGILKEPIEWIVLDKKDNSALLLSKYIIDCKAFDYVNMEDIDRIEDNQKENFKYCDWGTSSLRKWLNEEFLETSFTNDEKEKILQTHLEDTNTYDKIFCLNEDEYKKYFDNGNYYEIGRELGGHHIYYNGATIRNKKAQNYDKYSFFEPDETYIYWLRDKTINMNEQGIEFGATKIIDPYGGINLIININDFVGVRPAMWVSLE